MTEPRQKQFLAMGKEGCLFFSLIECAEAKTGGYIDSYLAYLKFLRTLLPSGLSYIEENCYVNDIGAVFSSLTGEKWTCTKEDVSHMKRPDELEITRLEKKTSPTVTATHFVVTDGNGKMMYDPLAASLDGWVPAKKYILRRMA